MQHASTFMRKLGILAAAAIIMVAAAMGVTAQKAFASGNTAVVAEKTAYTVTIGAEDTLTALLIPEGVQVNLADARAEWTIADKTIAKLGKAVSKITDEQGTLAVPVTGLKAGKTRVTLKVYNKSGAVVGTQFFTVNVVKKTQNLKVAKIVAATNYNGSITKAAYPIKSVTGNVGAITYSKVSGPDFLSITKTGATAGITTGKVTVQPKTLPGEYTMVMRITAAETETYAKATKDVTVKIKVSKFRPTITVSKVAAAVNYSAVKDQVKKGITSVICASPDITYSKVSVVNETAGKRADANFSVASDTGMITIKKGTPKGTYKVQIKVKSAETAGYLSNFKTVTVTVYVK